MILINEIQIHQQDFLRHAMHIQLQIDRVQRQDRWRKLRGFNYLADVILGIKFVKGMRENIEKKSVNEEVAA